MGTLIMGDLCFNVRHRGYKPLTLDVILCLHGVLNPSPYILNPKPQFLRPLICRTGRQIKMKIGKKESLARLKRG